MGRRRFRPTALDTVNEPRWLMVDDPFGAHVAAVHLPPKSDLAAAINFVAERFRTKGWTIESDDFAYGTFYCNRNGVRLFVHLRPTDPWKLLPGGHASASDWKGRSACPVCQGGEACANCPTCKGIGKVHMRNLREVTPPDSLV